MAIDKFWGCCSLKRGAIVWGSLSLVLDAAKFITSVVLLATQLYGFVTIVVSLTMFATIIDIITSILLIIGAIQKRRDFILVWLVFNFAEIACTVAFINVVYPALILFAPFLYAWVCIFTFYKSLRNEQQDVGYNNASDSNEPLRGVGGSVI